MGKIFDMMVISVVYILICIPIITIGPATTALYYVVVKVIRRERGYVFREFFKSFKLNFKKGTLIGVLLTIVQLILIFDLYYAWNLLEIEPQKASILLGVFISLNLLSIGFSIYVFPMLSRFEMSFKQLIKGGIYMCLRHLPYTILMVVTFLISAVVTILSGFLFAFIGPSLTMLVISLMMERVLRRYMPESKGQPKDTGIDEWYLE